MEVLQPLSTRLKKCLLSTRLKKCLRTSHSCALTPPMATPIPWIHSLKFTVRTKDNVVGPLLASSLPT
jgi:hypothetical protein